MFTLLPKLSVAGRIFRRYFWWACQYQTFVEFLSGEASNACPWSCEVSWSRSAESKTRCWGASKSYGSPLSNLVLNLPRRFLDAVYLQSRAWESLVPAHPLVALSNLKFNSYVFWQCKSNMFFSITIFEVFAVGLLQPVTIVIMHQQTSIFEHHSPESPCCFRIAFWTWIVVCSANPNSRDARFGSQLRRRLYFPKSFFAITVPGGQADRKFECCFWDASRHDLLAPFVAMKSSLLLFERS